MQVIAVILLGITALIIIGDFFLGFREYGSDAIVLLVKIAQLLFWSSFLYLFLSSAKRDRLKN
ncbi:hypothetical protein ACI2JA_16505 [Alkalihalobacillus sp. NPDC078783]